MWKSLKHSYSHIHSIFNILIFTRVCKASCLTLWVWVIFYNKKKRKENCQIVFFGKKMWVKDSEFFLDYYKVLESRWKWFKSYENPSRGLGYLLLNLVNIHCALSKFNSIFILSFVIPQTICLFWNSLQTFESFVYRILKICQTLNSTP